MKGLKSGPYQIPGSGENVASREVAIRDKASQISSEVVMAVIALYTQGDPKPLQKIAKERPREYMEAGKLYFEATGRTTRDQHSSDEHDFVNTDDGIERAGLGESIITIDFEEYPIPRFEADYRMLPRNIQERCPWEEVERRLKAKVNGKKYYYLNLAAKLGGGFFFGIDEQGNPLFTKMGTEPMYRGGNFMQVSRKIYGRNYDARKEHYGFEMFPVDFGGDEKIYLSDEMHQLAMMRGFIAPESALKDWRMSWTSGKAPDGRIAVVYWDPRHEEMSIGLQEGKAKDYRLGAMPMLRVKNVA